MNTNVRMFAQIRLRHLLSNSPSQGKSFWHKLAIATAYFIVGMALTYAMHSFGMLDDDNDYIYSEAPGILFAWYSIVMGLVAYVVVKLVPVLFPRRQS